MSDNRAIGIFDSGLGGLTVAKEIMRFLPEESIVYFGDTGRVPYGTRSLETIKKYAREDERFLLKNDVKLIIAACGTVSSVAADTALELPIPFVEVVSHSVDAAISATKTGKIGVLATSATIRSGAHRRLIEKKMPAAKVTENKGTLLVPLVEEGWCSADDEVVIGTLRRYLAPFIEAECDTLILGCTHFPMLKEAIGEIMGEGVTLIDMGTATAAAVAKILREKDALNSGEVSHSFYVSDKPASFLRLASALLEQEISPNQIEQVDINSI